MIATEELRFGYTLDDVDHIARGALLASRTMAAAWEDRYEAARFAVIERIYGDEHWVRRDELLRAATRAVHDLARKELQHHGVDRQNMDNLAAGRKHAGFFMFWEGHLTFPSHEDYVIERVALQQAWDALTATDRRILTTQALYGDNGIAAEALGKPRTSYTVQLNQARRRFRALWWQGETSQAWATDQRGTGNTTTTTGRAMAWVRRRKRDGAAAKPKTAPASHCRRGHLKDEANTRISASGARVCRACENAAKRSRFHARNLTPAVGPAPTSRPRTRSATKAADRRAEP